METPPYLARRAMLEDLDDLRALWEVEQLEALHLDRTFTDFQVVETDDGRIIAAIGLQLEGKQGRLHSEAFEDFGLTTVLRPLLWERIQTLARNRGLTRLWTQETAPFWREQGLESAPIEVLEKLPAAFDTGKPGWLTLKLKDEVLAGLTEAQEFALFKQAAQESTDQLKRQARIMNIVATSIAIVFAIMVFFMIMVWRKYDAAKQSGRLPAPASQR